MLQPLVEGDEIEDCPLTRGQAVCVESSSWKILPRLGTRSRAARGFVRRMTSPVPIV
jgi:hypothetical protein